jgi:hypothetical protein
MPLIVNHPPFFLLPPPLTFLAMTKLEPGFRRAGLYITLKAYENDLVIDGSRDRFITAANDRK